VSCNFFHLDATVNLKQYSLFAATQCAVRCFHATGFETRVFRVAFKPKSPQIGQAQTRKARKRADYAHFLQVLGALA